MVSDTDVDGLKPTTRYELGAEQNPVIVRT